jgi:hypothetical protein
VTSNQTAISSTALQRNWQKNGKMSAQKCELIGEFAGRKLPKQIGAITAI